MARVGIPQIVAKMTEINERLKQCEESQKSSGFVTSDDVNHIVGIKLQEVQSQTKKYVTDDDLEDKFQKYLQSETNLTQQTEKNVADVKSTVDGLNAQIENIKTVNTQILEALDSLRSDNNALKAHNDALTITVNELKAASSSE
tara:strand:+ start:5159 stop:5590 length:432 start_codon:yes stop_codon:yes gene_type:complete